MTNNKERVRTTFDYMLYEDLGLQLDAGMEPEMDQAIRRKLLDTKIYQSQDLFLPKEQHAIEIFLRSGCKEVTSSLPTIGGNWNRNTVKFVQRQGLGGHRRSRLLKDVVNGGSQRQPRCQVLKNSMGWEGPFDYSRLVPGIVQTIDDTYLKKVRHLDYAKAHQYAVRRGRGTPSRHRSGSPYSHNRRNSERTVSRQSSSVSNSLNDPRSLPVLPPMNSADYRIIMNGLNALGGTPRRSKTTSKTRSKTRSKTTSKTTSNARIHSGIHHLPLPSGSVRLDPDNLRSLGSIGSIFNTSLRTNELRRVEQIVAPSQTSKRRNNASSTVSQAESRGVRNSVQSNKMRQLLTKNTASSSRLKKPRQSNKKK